MEKEVKTIKEFGEDFDRAMFAVCEVLGDCAITVSEEVYGKIRASIDVKAKEVGEKLYPHSIPIFQGPTGRVWIYKKGENR
jgi:hypothetical protein